LLGGKSVVITEFFACLKIALGHNPDGALGEQDVTVGVTGMIDIAGFIFEGLAVKIIAVIEDKNVLIVLIEAFGGFCLGNPLPDVLKNPRAFLIFWTANSPSQDACSRNPYRPKMPLLPCERSGMATAADPACPLFEVNP
jgi:hypothetical protein